jgi:MoxR-like ATPase
MSFQAAYNTLTRLSRNLTCVIIGQETPIQHLLAGFSIGGHILLEDVPGTGKTTLAKALALSIDASFKRIQFTPDLLPSDVVGISIFDQKDAEFRLHKGPVFTNILLVDEINRTSPRTQSALLEAMAEKQVSIDGQLHRLEDLFFVIATQNPIESHGTYPLPEAQMDRFSMQLNLGYVSLEQEVDILINQDQTHPIESISAVASLKDIALLKETVSAIHITDELRHYIVRLVQATRTCEGVALGASPRSSIDLAHAAKAIALFNERDYVVPDDIQQIAVPTIAHRIIMDSQAVFSGKTQRMIIEEILNRTDVPA